MMRRANNGKFCVVSVVALYIRWYNNIVYSWVRCRYSFKLSGVFFRMSYVPMKEMLLAAQRDGYGVGAFNIVNEQTARACIALAEEMRAPMLLQTSMVPLSVYGPEGMMDLLRPLAEKARVPVAVHLDHCTDPDFVKRCIDAGFTSVMMDASKLPPEENIAVTRDVVDYAHARGAVVEGELGAIVKAKDDLAARQSGEGAVSLEAARDYMARTGVDAFAPAVGTAHGLYRGEPKLNFELVRAIVALGMAPLVVHGGTGLSDENFRKLIAAGASKINISTAIKIAYYEGIAGYIQAHPDEKEQPLAIDQAAIAAVQDVVRRHIALFGTAHRV